MEEAGTDGELVRRTLGGETSAYEELVRRWAGRVAGVCHARVRSSDWADDLAQEAIVRGFRALATLADPERFGAWLCGIATRACLDWLKDRERTQVSFGALGRDRDPEEFLDGRAPRPEGEIDRRDELQRLLAEVEALPDRLRETLMLYYYNDLTYAELGKLLGVSAAAVNARLTKARGILRERMSGAWR